MNYKLPNFLKADSISGSSAYVQDEPEGRHHDPRKDQSMGIIRKIFDKISRRAWEMKMPPSIKRKIFDSRGLLVLMYHSTPKYESDYAYATHESSFKEQMSFLSEHFEVLSMKEVIEFIQGLRPASKTYPMVAITFDDGYQDNYDVAWPVLKDKAIPFSVFLTTNFISENNGTFMSWHEVEELQKSKMVTLGAHCRNHFNLKALKEDDKLSEIVGSKCIIEEHIHNSIETFAYPGGGYDECSLEIVKQNYSLGFKDRCIGNDSDSDSRKVGRINIDARHDSFKNFLIEIAKAPFLEAKK